MIHEQKKFDVARLDDLVQHGCADESFPRELAEVILDEANGPSLLPLLDAAGRVREHFFGRRVLVHRLNNVKNGACPEDCGYCGQSRDSDAPIQPYRLKAKEEIIAEAGEAKAAGAFRYCMALSGRGPDDAEIDHMVGCITEIKSRFGLETCLSAGLMDTAKAARLKKAGLDRLNHNLNSSESHYGSICSTHTYQDRVDTLHAARAAGLSLCSGIIIGMGESACDVVEVAYRLREFRAESIPVNFLIPIEGNPVVGPLFGGEPLTPERCLRVLCLFRLVNPSAEVRVGAGREGHLRSMQAMSLYPANSLFIDGYLLTKGSAAMETCRMVTEAGFELEFPDGGPPEGFMDDLAGDSAGSPTSNLAFDGTGDILRPEKKKKPVGENKPPRKTQLSVQGTEVVPDSL